MKITDLAILFVIITLPFILVLRIQSDSLQSISFKNTLLNRYLDTAVEDASEAMIVRGINNQVTLSRSNALEAFFQTLFTNFDVIDNEYSRDRLMVYVPVVVLIDYDGYWVYSMEEFINNAGDREQKMVWKPKKPFTCEREGYVFLFTLDLQVKVYDTAAHQFYEGNASDLKEVLPCGILEQEEVFEAVRESTIIEAIKGDVNEAINTHNTYASRFGITYRFSPPSISNDDWHRNIEDAGFLAFFQGIPLGLAGERFNSFALGAARIVRKDQFYIQKDGNGLSYYHKEYCSELSGYDQVYDSREDCALKGAFPCHTCKP